MSELRENVSLQQLRTLVAVDECGSFTLAAERLGLSQPAVSHLVRRLENEVGQALVTRGRQVRLTRNGRALADTARRAILAIDSSLNECRSQTGLKTGSVVIATGHVTAASLLPAILAAFGQAHPGIATSVEDCTVERIKTRLLSQEADLGMGALDGIGDSELVTEARFAGALDVFVHAGHPLARRQSIGCRALEQLDCIQLNPLAPPWTAINIALATAGVRPNWKHRVNLLSTAVGMLQAGMGVALLPAIAARQMPADVRVLRLREPELAWPISIVRLAQQPPSPAVQAFLKTAKEVMNRGRRKSG
ncbi:MAG: lysR family transcriptional regulator [Paucimonas sp.]|nr:lysR family transcriptional regulator [Paucimonas sp.]